MMAKKNRIKETLSGPSALRGTGEHSVGNSPLVQTRRFSSRTLILAVLASFVTAVGGYKFLEDSKPAPKSASSVVPENPVKNEIVLGKNVRFYFQNENDFSDRDRAVIFANMQKAYDKLEAFLGQEVMTSYGNFVVPIIAPRGGEQGAKLLFENIPSRFDLQHGGEPLVMGRVSPASLMIEVKDEDVIAHELVHLFAQFNDTISSQAFTEGHAYAIQALNYGFHKNVQADELVKNSAISAVIDEGLDSNGIDQGRGGGVQNRLLDRLLASRWMLVWLEYAKKDPNFFKIFYTELGRQRNAGKVNFFKDDLLQIAAGVTPGFRDWYENQPSLKSLGSNQKEHNVVKAIKVDSTHMVLFDFSVTSRNVEFSGMVRLPSLSPAIDGPVEVEIEDDSGNKSRFGQTLDLTYAQIALPRPVTDARKITVKVGGKQIPLN